MLCTRSKLCAPRVLCIIMPHGLAILRNLGNLSMLCTLRMLWAESTNVGLLRMSFMLPNLIMIRAHGTRRGLIMLRS